MSDAAEITPLAETPDTVTLRRADYEALLAALEDAADVAALRMAEAAVERGESELLPVDMVERMLAGENPVRVWRSHRSLSAQALAQAAGIAPSYLSEIEAGKKPGSLDAHSDEAGRLIRRKAGSRSDRKRALDRTKAAR